MKNLENYNALRAAGLFDSSLDSLAEQDSEWTENFMKLVHQSQLNNILDPKLIVLIRLILDVTTTHLYSKGTRRHIVDALRLGISRKEILEVFKLSSIIGIHSCALGVPILEAELTSDDLCDDVDLKVKTPICDEVRSQGNFNPLWETLFKWDPEFLENYLSVAFSVWKNAVLPPIWIELLCVAADAAITHLWAHGTKRHMQAALSLGATQAEILEVLKIVSLQGIESCEFGVPILNEIIEELNIQDRM